MTRILTTLLLALAATVAGAATSLEFDDNTYALAKVEQDKVGLRNLFLREGESLTRYSRLVRISDLSGAPRVADLARSAAAMARLRAPNMGAETFAPEGREAADVTVAWLQVSDADDALEYHVVRYVAGPRSTREYAFIVRQYLNGQNVSQALETFGPFAVGNLGSWVADVGALDLAPRARQD
jgi:hypothetical protein